MATDIVLKELESNQWASVYDIYLAGGPSRGPCVLGFAAIMGKHSGLNSTPQNQDALLGVWVTQRR